jgi:ArpU family phage transcriptional regulator
VSVIYSVTEKEIQDAVIKDLKDFKALKVKIENIRARKAAEATNLFPPLTNDESLTLEEFERALRSLDPTERKIIEKKYLESYDNEITDIEIYMSLGLKKGKYYVKKKEAINQLAKRLGYIPIERKF